MSTFKRSKIESAIPGTVEQTGERSQCDWQADGERCRYPGTMSTGLQGEGPWYCSAHFGCSNPVMGADIVKASQDYRPQTSDRAQAEAAAYCRKRGLDSVAKMRAFVKSTRVTGKRLGNTSWALAIMDRIERGEKLPIISERLAREALSRPEREPGEDQEEKSEVLTDQRRSG